MQLGEGCVLASDLISIVYGQERCDPDIDFVVSVRPGKAQGAWGHRGPIPMIPMPCSCAPANRTPSPIFQLPLRASGQRHRRSVSSIHVGAGSVTAKAFRE